MAGRWKGKSASTSDASDAPELATFPLNPSGLRRVAVRKYKGMMLVDIREMYNDKNTGELKPGAKGISLSVEQFSALMGVMDDLVKTLRDNGADLGAARDRAASSASSSSSSGAAAASASAPSSGSGSGSGAREAAQPALKRARHQEDADDDDSDDDEPR